MSTPRIAGYGLLTMTVALTDGGREEVTAEDALAKRFLEEAPRRWKEHEAIARNLEANIASTLSWDDGTHATIQIRVVLGTDDTAAIYDYYDSQVDNTDSASAGVYGSNQRYAFELTRPRPDAELLIDDVTVRSGSTTKTNMTKAASRARLYASQQLRRLNNVDLYDIVCSRDFRVATA
jgi:hypothetical protein